MLKTGLASLFGLLLDYFGAVIRPQDVIAMLRRLLFRFTPSPGTYEVLEHDVTLELKDTKGKKAIYTKHQHIRFTRDGVTTYDDKAWGDGKIFAGYKCSPGKAVDRYKEGHRYRILISLRETKNKGDEETIHIERTILNGFMESHEDLQTDIDHRMRKLSVSVIFPKRRHPKETYIIEQNTAKNTPLDHHHYHTLPDGRCKVTWKMDNPKLFEHYLLAWEW